MSSPAQQQKTEAKAIPGPSVAHPTVHVPLEEQDHHVNADLYRTFSPTDIAFYDWRAEFNKSNAAGKPSTGFLSRLFGSFTSKKLLEALASQFRQQLHLDSLPLVC